jgi:hypothetical protein
MTNERLPRYAEILAWLEATRDREIDCDQFLELIGPWLEGSLQDPQIVALLEHHRDLCTECAEELELLRAALGAEP